MYEILKKNLKLFILKYDINLMLTSYMCMYLCYFGKNVSKYSLGKFYKVRSTLKRILITKAYSDLLFKNNFSCHRLRALLLHF